jgi:hypothetical protein
MTTKHIPIALILLSCFTVAVSAQNMAGKTFTKAFNSDGKSKLRLELPGSVDLKVWDNPSIRFEISVNLPANNGSMLNELANIGRYNLMAKEEGDILVITAPNLQKQLKVKGEVLKENLTFVVFVPKDMQVEMMPPGPVLADAKK